MSDDKRPWPKTRYLARFPRSRHWSEGDVLVHNHVRPEGFLPDTPPGTDGFRAWTQARDDRLALCDCGWAPAVGPHYRVLRPEVRA